MRDGSVRRLDLLEEILVKSTRLDCSGELDDLVDKYLEEECNKFVGGAFSGSDLEYESVFGTRGEFEDERLIFGNSKDKSLVLRIQDEILRINVELEVLKKEQESRRRVLGSSVDQKAMIQSVGGVLDEELEFLETEDVICENLDIDIGGINSTAPPGTSIQVNSVYKEAKTVSKKRKTNRRYFRRKNTSAKEKAELDENEKILRSRTPLDVITLASRYYVRELRSDLDAGSDSLQQPIAQDHRRGPYLTLGLGNIRDVQVLNSFKSSMEGENWLFLNSLSSVYRLESLNFVSRSQMTDKASRCLSYESNFAEGTGGVPGYRAFPFLLGGVEFISHDLDALGNRMEDFEDGFQHLCSSGGGVDAGEIGGVGVPNNVEVALGCNQEETALATSSLEQENAQGYNYLASVTENSACYFKKARQKIRISVLPGRLGELESLLEKAATGVQRRAELGRFRVRFRSGRRSSGEASNAVSILESPYETEYFGGAMADSLERMSLENKKRLEAARRLVAHLQGRISKYDSSTEYNELSSCGGFDSNKGTGLFEKDNKSRLAFLISAYNYLSDEIRMLELSIEGGKQEKEEFTIPIYMDDLVVNRDIQDHLELILGVPESIPLMPYFTSLCYPAPTLTPQQEMEKDPVSRLRPVGDDFYHPLNQFGLPPGMKRVQKHIWRRRRLLRSRLSRIRRCLPAIYRAYRRFVAEKEIKNIGSGPAVLCFDVPYSLKFGAFDDLVRLADDLAKHDTGVEVVLRRVERLSLELDPTMELRIIWQRSSFTVQQYLRNFSWDHAKFPKERSMKENLGALLQSVQKLDLDLRTKSAQFNDVKMSLQNSMCKSGGGLMTAAIASEGGSSGSNLETLIIPGSLNTKDLTDVITPEHIEPKDIIDTEHIVTVFVIVPKGAKESFLNSYESFDKYVVPKSAKFIPRILDKDGSEVVRVLLFKSSLENFKTNCKSNKFVVRDDFKYSQEKYSQLVNSRQKLLQEKDKQEKYLKRMCFAGFSDIFISWMHVKAMRCFVEAVLRYGVPPQFASFLISMDPNPSKVKKVQNCVEKVFTEMGRIGATFKSNERDEDDYTPYVLLQFSPYQQSA